MKNLSKAAKLRLSPLKAERSRMMSLLAKAKHAKLTQAQRTAHAVLMVQAREAKRKLSTL